MHFYCQPPAPIFFQVSFSEIYQRTMLKFFFDIPDFYTNTKNRTTTCIYSQIILALCEIYVPLWVSGKMRNK